MGESVFEYVIAQLDLHKGQWSKVAKDTGISRRTIEKIANGDIVDPGITKMEKLADYFRSLKRPRGSGSRQIAAS